MCFLATHVSVLVDLLDVCINASFMKAMLCTDVLAFLKEPSQQQDFWTPY